MDVGYQTATQVIIGGPANTVSQVRPESELESITSRIHRMATNADEIACRLRAHADSMFGPQPEPCTESCDARTGQLGALHDALDRLGRVHDVLAAQAARNCTLA